MKTTIRELLVLLLLGGAACASAQEAVEGIWEGQLEVSPGTAISVQFTLSEENGAWSAVLNSPDMGAIKNIAANAVSFDGTTLDIKVDALSGAYNGTFADGTFTGNWSQPGATIPMNLSPFEAKVLSEEAIATLMGQWSGKLVAPGITFTIAFHFERDEAGNFVGFIQNVDAGAPRQPLADISLEGSDFFFRVPAANGAEYRGTLSGDGINGRLKQGPQDMELNVTKGAPEAPTFDISAADMATLMGQWNGKLKTPQAEMAIVFHFERDESGNFTAAMQNMTVGSGRIPLQDLKVENGQNLSFRIPAMNGTYTGTISGDAITGSVVAGPATMELNVVKGEYVPDALPTLALSDADYEKLSGRWSGKLGPLTMVMEIERQEDGSVVGFIGSPEQGSRVSISSAALEGSVLSLQVQLINAQFNAELGEGTLDGSWTQGGMNNPLILTRE